MSTNTLRTWVRRSEVNEGRREGFSDDERDELRRFEAAVPVSRRSLASHLGVSERTLLRRLHEDKHFSAPESDRLYRLIDLYSQAADVLGSLEAASEWMTGPAPALGDQTLLAYATNEAGAKRVEQLFVRIDTRVLLNPEHPNFGQVVIHAPEPFLCDARLER